MNRVRVTRVFHFEAAHALYGYDGKCRHIHGHGYELHVTLMGEPLQDPSHPKQGMVMDFGDIKQCIQQHIIEQFDHALLLCKHTPFIELADALQQHTDRIVWLDYTPTCENLVIDFARRIQSVLPAHVQLHHLTLYETPSSYASWYAEDQPA
ncbi:6-pyruvoyl trahydropterin synthase family protein [Thermoflavifilum thermophilum]|uniref:6-carboxy-5,6,7,8-tetrahydropterin synthase n=1 Tax=Thermoflavifilum thermophilum TaxID=1393122 RepID=A0A1I7N158_9BACT|nr:6-carboxytetrahydropterin synthase [Thermoflavifilum thermophilum]SFV28380.1 6-pyruvoyltetrahydropterin/6-carboxytetrahydropterin synthase [Thermoflavifilum thermophilum]